MAEIIATRPMKVLGQEIKAGDRIPTERMDPRRVKQLVDHRRAVENSVRVNKRGG